MSIVGTRPPLISETNLYEPRHKARGLSFRYEVLIYNTVCVEELEKIDFDILALGEDHRGGRFNEVEQWCNEHGKKVVRLKRTPGICSSAIKDNLKRE